MASLIINTSSQPLIKTLLIWNKNSLSEKYLLLVDSGTYYCSWTRADYVKKAVFFLFFFFFLYVFAMSVGIRAGLSLFRCQTH